MGVKKILQVTCDRCGKQCSGVYEKVLSQDVCNKYELTQKIFTDNFYHYTEMFLIGYDNRFKCAKQDPIILCGECVDKLGEWLKKGGIE